MRDVTRLDLGYFVRPAAETGTGQPRVEPVLAYIVRLAEGLLVFDTGMGHGPADLEAHYRPTRRDLRAALRSAGADLDEVRLVVNCHLHFDHCGGNRLLAGRPVVVQRSELDAARGEDYTLPELVDFSGVTYDEIDGEVELATGVLVIPTPGHTRGHQSLVVRCEDGTLIVAGQTHDNASAYAGDHLAWRAREDGAGEPLPAYAPWLPRLAQLDPRRVVFAHDLAVWEISR